jgi:hypothetical protein
MALGLGNLEDNAPAREILFTRDPGTYVITEIVRNESGRYISKRIFVDPELLAISRLDTYRPDGALDMTAEMTFNRKAAQYNWLPVSAKIIVLREKPFLLDLTFEKREFGKPLPAARFAVPNLRNIPEVHDEDSPSK